MKNESVTVAQLKLFSSFIYIDSEEGELYKYFLHCITYIPIEAIECSGALILNNSRLDIDRIHYLEG